MAAFRVSKAQANRLARQSQTDYQKAKKQPYSRFVGVPVNPATGRPAARARTGQAVIWATLDTETGWVRELESKDKQKYSKRQYKALNRQLKRTGKPDILIYEQKSSRRRVDEAGHVEWNKHTGESVRELVQRFDKPEGDIWRQVYYKQSQRVHEIDPRLMARSEREKIDAALAIDAEQIGPGLYLTTAPVPVTGDTIRDAVKNVRLPFSYQDLADQDVDLIYANGVLNVAGEQHPFRVKITEMSNFVAELSYGIRENLARRGLKYTDEVKLNSFEEELDDLLAEHEAELEEIAAGREAVRQRWLAARGENKARLRAALSGMDDRSEELKKKVDYDLDRARHSLYNIAGKNVKDLQKVEDFSIGSLSFELHPRARPKK